MFKSEVTTETKAERERLVTQNGILEKVTTRRHSIFLID